MDFHIFHMDWKLNRGRMDLLKVFLCSCLGNHKFWGHRSRMD